MNYGDIALGIDIGGTGTKLGLVDRQGLVEGFRSFPTAAGGDDPGPFLARLADKCQAVLAEARRPLAGIGVSTHGYIDDERRGPIACQSTPALRGVDLRGWLEIRFGLPVVLNNDLTAHALGEHRFGAGRGARRFLCLAIGTGLGAGVVIDGRPLRIIGGNAGDTGRIILEPGGPKCAYGVSGSAEALCGVDAIERLAEERYGRPAPAQTVIEAARLGEDEAAVEIMKIIGKRLGMALASLSVLYLPDRIALTGGTTMAGPVLLDACRQQFNAMVGDYHAIVARLTGDYYHGVEIVLGETGSRAGLLGAVVELWEEL